MPSTVVHAGLALVLAIGLLGEYRKRSALAIVLLVAIVLPELDTAAGLVLDGAHRTLGHTLVLAVVAGAAIAWDTHREDSHIRNRVGDYGVRVAWVTVFVYAFVGVGLDWAHLEGVNILWPVHDQFFRLQGHAYLSSSQGVVQTFVEIVHDTATGEPVLDVGGGGTREETHVANPVQPVPDPGAEPGPVERSFPIAVQGWQLYFVCLGIFTVAAKRVQSSLP